MTDEETLPHEEPLADNASSEELQDEELDQIAGGTVRSDGGYPWIGGDADD